MIRKVVFWMHLVSAVTVGSIILILSVTGALLTYERQIVERAERAYFVDVSADQTRLPIEAVVTAAERFGAQEIDPSFRATSLVLRHDLGASLEVRGGREARVYVDAYTGSALGTGFPRLEGFFERVRAWHRWLNVAAPSIRRGRAVTGAANLVFLFMISSGLFLWMPRQWSWKRFRVGLFFRRGTDGRARNFNWHHVIGIWSAVPLLVILGSATVTSYPGFADRVYPRVAPLVSDRGLPPLTVEDRTPASPADLTSAVEAAQQAVTDWRRIELTLPSDRADAIALHIDAGTGGQPQHSGTLTIDRATGEAREWETFADLGPERRAQEFLRYAHTGEYWGPVGQTFAGLFSLAVVVMIWTGASLAVHRLRRALRKRASQRRAAV